MSNKDNSSYPYNYDHNHNMGSEGFPIFSYTSDHNSNPFMYNHHLENPTGFDHPSSDDMPFTSSFFHDSNLSAASHLSCSTSEAPNYAVDNPPTTPNSSVSFPSSDAGAEEDSSKISRKDLQQEVSEDGDLRPEKVSKGKKKEEKKKRESRFAFMTKSEMDNLEDGYRWRKYGQKAVKNSPFPRNYYKCTTQKCSVKKRIERSSEDPSMVVTTYEGRHNHHSPATLRGNSGMFLPSLLSVLPQVAFPQNFVFPTNNNTHHDMNSNSPFFTLPISPHPHQFPVDQCSPFTNMDSSFLHKQQPYE